MRNSVLGVWEAFILLCALWRNISRKITCVPERTGRRSKSGMCGTHGSADLRVPVIRTHELPLNKSVVYSGKTAVMNDEADALTLT